MALRRKTSIAELAPSIAANGLLFVVSEPARLQRFLEETGVDMTELRAKAASTGMQGAVLEHLLADESLLLVFCAEHGYRAEDVAPAAQWLLDQGSA